MPAEKMPYFERQDIAYEHLAMVRDQLNLRLLNAPSGCVIKRNDPQLGVALCHTFNNVVQRGARNMVKPWETRHQQVMAEGKRRT